MFAILAQSILTNDDSVVAYVPTRKAITVNTWEDVVTALHLYAEQAHTNCPQQYHTGFEFYIQKEGSTSVLFRTAKFDANGEYGRPIEFAQSFFTL